MLGFRLRERKIGRYQGTDFRVQGKREEGGREIIFGMIHHSSLGSLQEFLCILVSSMDAVHFLVFQGLDQQQNCRIPRRPKENFDPRLESWGSLADEVFQGHLGEEATRRKKDEFICGMNPFEAKPESILIPKPKGGLSRRGPLDRCMSGGASSSQSFFRVCSGQEKHLGLILRVFDSEGRWIGSGFGRQFSVIRFLRWGIGGRQIDLIIIFGGQI